MKKTDLQRLPDFVINHCRDRAALHSMKAMLRKSRLRTVCEEARCPNQVECFKRPTAAFMILGRNCARGCRFCAVEAGRPSPPDPAEPLAVALAARELGLRHVVVTSVTRDDLPDGGAGQFATVIREMREHLPGARVEVLVPDFLGNRGQIDTVLAAGPDVFNHNLETVPRLYREVRPGADYGRSLGVLEAAARRGGALVKSGLMVGLGEEPGEIVDSLRDLANVGCRLVTVGQYLRPRRSCLPVFRYLDPSEYELFREEGRALGLEVFAGPLVRSSYMADQAFEKK